MKISILDYSVIDKNKQPLDAFNDTIELAKHAEKLGYYRFWVSEHHNVRAFAGSSPELLLMRLITETKTIRLGSGGVMLPHYSSLKVAENFKILSTFAPGRIDLGVGFTVGTKEVYNALNEHKTKTAGRETAISDIMYYLEPDDEDHRFSTIKANPTINFLPELWLLSTNARSAKLAARRGINFAFGLFPSTLDYSDNLGQEALNIYRTSFVPSKFSKEPKILIALFVAIADDENLAENFAKILDVWLLGNDAFNEFTTYPTYEDIADYKFKEEDFKKIELQRRSTLVGNKEQAKRQFENIIDTYNPDEIMIVPLLPDVKNRMRTIEIVAEIFNEL